MKVRIPKQGASLGATATLVLKPNITPAMVMTLLLEAIPQSWVRG